MEGEGYCVFLVRKYKESVAAITDYDDDDDIGMFTTAVTSDWPSSLSSIQSAAAAAAVDSGSK